MAVGVADEVLTAGVIGACGGALGFGVEVAVGTDE